MVSFNNCGGFKPEASLGLSVPDSGQSNIPINAKSTYDRKCQACHGDFESSTKRTRAASQIQNAVYAVPAMKFVSVSDAEIKAIASSWGGDATLGNNPDQQRFVCSDPTARGSSQRDMRRLTSHEFTNTLKDLVGATIFAKIESLARYPSDDLEKDVGEFSKLHTFQHVDSIVNVSMEVAQELMAAPTEFAKIAPACLPQELSQGIVTQACMTTFVTTYGRRVFRRPLTASEVASLIGVMTTTQADINPLPVKDKVELVLARLFQSPSLHFHMIKTTPATSANRVKVDAYTVASRISYGLTGGPPDDTLLNAARDGKLETLEGVKAQGLRLQNTAGARRQFRDMVTFWLRLNNVVSPATNALVRAGLPSDGATRNRIRTEIANETLDFAEHIVFTLNGTYEDLMTSKLSFPKSNELAKILGVTLPSPIAPVASTDGRQGLLMRPSLLLSNYERERPIYRGVVVRTRFLCDIIPPPPADADQAATDNISAVDPLSLPAREVTSITTKNTSCTVCHNLINPLGYVLGGFGPLGEKRSLERVYNPAGAEVSSFPLNTQASDLNIARPNDHASDAADVVKHMVESTKARACLVQNIFRYNRVQQESESDHCGLGIAEAAVRSGRPVKEVILETLVNEDIFWKGI